MSVTNIDGLLNQVDLTPDSLQGEVPELTHAEEGTIPVKNIETSSENNNSNSDNKELTEDDYGQPIAKKERVYTESEVQQMMRDRNARGEFARQEALKQQEAQPIQSANNDAQEGDWEQQLESFVEQTLTKREQKLQEQQWRQQQEQAQAEFEVKFNSGAAKYPDFEQVVVGKSLTPQMVIATRGMADPAAFIYAAAKTQSTELERISKIPDAFAQAVELGKLEERMRKVKAASSGAPKPIDSIKGDAVERRNVPKSVDDILREEAAARSKGRR